MISARCRYGAEPAVAAGTVNSCGWPRTVRLAPPPLGLVGPPRSARLMSRVLAGLMLLSVGAIVDSVLHDELLRCMTAVGPGNLLPDDPWIPLRRAREASRSCIAAQNVYVPVMSRIHSAVDVGTHSAVCVAHTFCPHLLHLHAQAFSRRLVWLSPKRLRFATFGAVHIRRGVRHRAARWLQYSRG